MDNFITHALRLLMGVDADGNGKSTVELAKDVPDEKCEIRYVRDGNHVGKAFSGDRVRIAKAELAHPSVAKALLTEAEYAELMKNRARRLVEMTSPQVTPAMRSADAALERNQQTAKDRDERARTERHDRDEVENARLDRAVAEIAGRLRG